MAGKSGVLGVAISIGNAILSCKVGMFGFPAWAPLSGVSGLETEGPAETLDSVDGLDAANTIGPVEICALSAAPLESIVVCTTGGNRSASIVGTEDYSARRNRPCSS